MRYDYSNPRNYLYVNEGRRRKKKNIFLPILLFFVVFGLLIYSLQWFLFYSSASKRIISPISNSVKVLSTMVSAHSGLEQVIPPLLARSQGEYAVYIKNLKTGETYTLNEHKKFATASLYKLWVMGAVYEKVSKGQLNLTDKLDKQVPDLNKEFNIASSDAELTDGEINTSVDNALKQMITISSNYSALILTDKVRLTSLNSFLQEYEFTESSTGTPPTSTVYDIAKFYEDLYKGVIVSPQYSKIMLDLLKQQQLNDRIPKYLPDEVDVAHKTGELDGNKHDAGIVYTPKGDYILVVMTNTNNPATAAEKIAEISKDVYNYFQKEE